ncbi:hypothetical protein O9361_05185 [Proteus vulgaris]|uniref:hypothetical protein n=1 Tax=Proteus vulgaris TaxID=585 RepID=UPI0025760230|nr:hypothetical protein [Proteus vulgaris]MDM3563008.1 hypothetical protein [Proteus vulgaris]
MTDEIKAEINALQQEVARGHVYSWELHRLNLLLLVVEHYLSENNPKEAYLWAQSIFQWIDSGFHDEMKKNTGDINAWFNKQMEGSVSTEQALKITRELYPEIEKLRTA